MLGLCCCAGSGRLRLFWHGCGGKEEEVGGGTDYCILAQRSIKSGIGWEGNRKRAVKQVQLRPALDPIVHGRLKGV